MEQFNADMMKVMVEARQENIRNSVAAARAAEQAHDEYPSRAKELLNNVVAFAKRLSTHSPKAVESSEAPQVKLSNEQVG